MKPFLALLLLCAPLLGACAQSPVDRHGLLQASGNQIIGTHGKSVSLAGVSLGWSQWESARFYDADAINFLAEDWHAGIVRAALGIHKVGYLSHPEENIARIETVVDAAIAAGIYVIIDWHDHHAHEHPELATAYFERMARKYGEKPNVIYEIYNEPLKGVSWSDDVKPYAERVIDAIRAIDPDNLIIVGSPLFSQEVDKAAADPIRDANIAYSLHFYAGTHKAWLRDKALTALNAGVALFVTEWGTCNADGNGPIDAESVNEWLAFMREWNLSHCNWGLNDKLETASLVQPGAPSDGAWGPEDLTESGALVRGIIRDWQQ